MDDYVNPDFKRVALLTIDVQRDFTLPGAPLEIPGTLEVLPRIQYLVQAFRGRRKPIVHVVRLYLTDGSNADPCRRRSIESGKPALVPGSEGAELMAELKPAPDTRLDAERLLAGELQSVGSQEWVMYKPRWGAFFIPLLSSTYAAWVLIPWWSAGATSPTARAPQSTRPASGISALFLPGMPCLRSTSGAWQSWRKSGLICLPQVR